MRWVASGKSRRVEEWEASGGGQWRGRISPRVDSRRTCSPPGRVSVNDRDLERALVALTH